jgi:bifunctional UDP-N-acetylglucosamine pyrophosphorylase/glucosamine-1-phosphate N-acetyltransferase
MNSTLPKVLHPLLGRPMLGYALEAVQACVSAPPVVVIGHGAEAVQDAFANEAVFAHQEEQLGTGHAVHQAEGFLQGKADLVLVTAGDMPLLRAATFQKMIAAQQAHPGPMTMLTMVSQQARGFGRVIRGAGGGVLAIVEEAQATREQLAIQEVNVGAYCFQAAWLWSALTRIPLSSKGEYYLTDLVEIAVREGLAVQALQLEDPAEGIGINTRVHLAEASLQMQARLNRQWMLAGVTLVNPQMTYIEPGVRIGRDTMIWPNTYLRGDTIIGEGCEIGPGTTIVSCQVGDHCRIQSSVLEYARLEDRVEMGPFAHLRKGAHLAEGVHMGNFGEIKNSYLGPGSKMGHFSYIGDATIGADVNIGAGTITCNYDGEKKSATEIGAGAFIGSDTMLVAPLKIGVGAHTGAGAVVTKNVPDHSLAVGVPARVIRKLEKRDRS